MRIRFVKRNISWLQEGVTLIELMIVVAIIALLSALAIPAYTDYSIRAQIAEGLTLAGSARTAVTEYYQSRSSFPTDNAEAGLVDAGEISGKYVASVSAGGAFITILFGNDANTQINGQTITLTAIDNLGSISWDCASTGFIQLKHLPRVCR